VGWNEGYVTDVGYTQGYVSLTNPFRAGLPLLHAGLAPPKIRTACELGFGQGVTIAINAAAQPEVEWWGADFMPDHVAFARALVEASGARCHLSDESFADFCTRPDLPEFDAVVVHGVWSWVSDENRAVIVDFLRRKLRVGGLLYLGYNVAPGWAPHGPLRHLLGLHAQLATAPGLPSTAKAEASLAFIERLIETNPAYLQSAPDAAAYFRVLKGKAKSYLSHEFLNAHWSAAPFSDTAALLAQAKLTFAASADYADHVRKLPPEQARFLAGLDTVALQETARDVMVNQRFRRDYWVKGETRLLPRDLSAAVRAQRFILVQPAAVAAAALAAADRHGVDQDAVDAVLAALADHAPRTLGEIEAVAGGLRLDAIIEAVIVCVAAGPVQAALLAAPVSAPAASALNRVLIDRAEGGEMLQLLASPVTGGAVHVPRLSQIFLGARLRGAREAPAMAAAAWTVLSSQGKAMVKEGRVLKTAEENIPEFEILATAFLATELPVLTALGVA
jgi:hypothetical protein